MTFLAVKDATFSYRVDMERERLLDEPKKVFTGVSFELPRGCRAIVVGENGVGKSTLFRLCAGVGTLDRGAIEIGGVSWTENRRSLTPKVALVATANWGASHSVLVRDIVERHNSDDLRKVLQLDKLLSRTTDQLSDGERRRVQLFVALAPSSIDLALIDEALTEIDVTIRRDLYAYFRRRNLSVLLATHVFDGIDQWPPTHLVVLHKDGRVHVEQRQSGFYDAARSALGLIDDVLDDDAPASDTDAAISVSELTWSYDATLGPAVEKLSLELRRGRRAVVCGSNGSAKSTLFALLAGVRVAPFSDAIRVLGSDPRETNLRATGQVAFLGGTFKSGLQDLPLRARNVPFSAMLPRPTDRLQHLMTILDVDPSWRPATASAGQTTRMQLVLQLAEPADLYLVDELTRDLDLRARDRILAFLKNDSLQRRSTILYATHVFNGLDTWATDLIHLHQGSIRHHLDHWSPSEASSLYDRVLAWLDEDCRLAVISPLPTPPSLSPAIDDVALPTGWASRENTIEATYGAHAWSARQAHGIFADRHSTPRQKFESLYLARPTS